MILVFLVHRRYHCG